VVAFVARIMVRTMIRSGWLDAVDWLAYAPPLLFLAVLCLALLTPERSPIDG